MAALGKAPLFIDAPSVAPGRPGVLRRRIEIGAPATASSPHRRAAGRATATDSTHPAFATPPARKPATAPSSARTPRAVLPPVAMPRVRHGQQDAYRCHAPGGDPGRGG